jgi:uncharacterized membrane protein YqjE
MIAATNHDTPGLATLVGRVCHVALKGVQTRVELLAVEWQEERLRLMDLIVYAIGLLLCGMLGVLFLTVTIIFLFPASARLYVTAGLAVLYLLAAIGAGLRLRGVLNRQPFAESIDQFRKDRLWLESLK